MLLAVWCGLVAGLGEGVLDLTLDHYHAPAMLGLGAPAYPVFFGGPGAVAAARSQASTWRSRLAGSPALRYSVPSENLSSALSRPAAEWSSSTAIIVGKLLVKEVQYGSSERSVGSYR